MCLRSHDKDCRGLTRLDMALEIVQGGFEENGVCAKQDLEGRLSFLYVLKIIPELLKRIPWRLFKSYNEFECNTCSNGGSSQFVLRWIRNYSSTL